MSIGESVGTSVWSGKLRAVEQAEEDYLEDRITLLQWIVVNYSFRFLPKCRRNLRYWFTQGVYTKMLREVDRDAPDYFDTVDVLTRVLLWCGDWKTAMEYAGKACSACHAMLVIAERYGVSCDIARHTLEHLFITKVLARAEHPDFRDLKEVWAGEIASHFGVWESETIPDLNQRVRVLAGYAHVAATYGLFWRAMKLGWQAVRVRGVSHFVQGKAMLALLALPFIWLRHL